MVGQLYRTRRTCARPSSSSSPTRARPSQLRGVSLARPLARLLTLGLDSLAARTRAVIPNPNPSATLHLLLSLLSHLTAPVSPSPSSSDKAAGTAGGCGWHPSQIHLFGYAQGGTCAAELALAWARAHPIPPPSSAGASSPSPSASPSPAQQTPPGLTAHLGSLVSISAPLLSHPTPSPSTLARTRALVLFRPGADERAVVPAAYQRGFVRAEAVKLPPGSGRGAEGMLRGRDEWERVMRFWSEVLGRKSALELSGEVYEVAQGSGAGAAR